MQEILSPSLPVHVPTDSRPGHRALGQQEIAVGTMADGEIGIVYSMSDNRRPPIFEHVDDPREEYRFNARVGSSISGLPGLYDFSAIRIYGICHKNGKSRKKICVVGNGQHANDLGKLHTLDNLPTLLEDYSHRRGYFTRPRISVAVQMGGMIDPQIAVHVMGKTADGQRVGHVLLNKQLLVRPGTGYLFSTSLHDVGVPPLGEPDLPEILFSGNARTLAEEFSDRLDPESYGTVLATVFRKDGQLRAGYMI